MQSALRKFLAEAAAAASGPMAMKQVLRRRKEMKVAAAEHGAMRVWGFGSLARREATEQSDVDILVSLEAGRTLFDLARMRGALERLLGVPVDVVTDDSLEGGLADEFLGDAVEL